MFNKDDLKQFFEKTNTTRREFFEYIGKMSLIAMVSSLNLSLSEEGQAENVNYNGGDLFDFTSLLNKECLFCYPIGICIIDGVPVPKIKYKIPVGFAETGDAGQFGKSSSQLSFLSYDYSYLKNDLINNKLTPNIPTGTRYGQVGQGQTKMQLYPHYYGLSPWMITQVQKAISYVNKKNPACTPCLPAVVAEAAAVQSRQVQLPSVVSSAAQLYLTKLMNESQSSEFVKRFYGNKQLASLMSSKIKYVNERFYQIIRDYNSAYTSNQIPSVPSELFAFIWAITELSPDYEKWKDVMLALQQAMKQGQVPMYELACPYMASYMLQNPEVAQAFQSSGFDPSFLCVGIWGNGYPRVGVVETQDPIVGGLLSIARWHDLISNKMRLVATPPQASWYQMYNPYIPEVGRQCFLPGWVTSDIFANNFNNLTVYPESPDIISAFQPYPPSVALIQEYYQDPLLIVAYFTINNITGLVNSVTTFAGGGWSLQGILEDINPFNTRYRNVGVIVYQEHVRCCFKPKVGGFRL